MLLWYWGRQCRYWGLILGLEEWVVVLVVGPGVWVLVPGPVPSLGPGADGGTGGWLRGSVPVLGSIPGCRCW